MIEEFILTPKVTRKKKAINKPVTVTIGDDETLYNQTLN